MYEEDPSLEVRRAAFEAISLMPEPDMAGLFESRLAGKDRYLRECAADGLARLPEASTAQLLRARFAEEKDRRVTLALAFALVARQEMPYLRTLMDSLDSRLYRDHSIAYLVELGRDPKILPNYYPFLRSEKPDIRRYLCVVLERLGNPEAMEHLQATMNDPVAEVAAAAAQAYRALAQAKK
jgi:HEAT repeat protein